MLLGEEEIKRGTSELLKQKKSNYRNIKTLRHQPSVSMKQYQI